MNDKKTILVVEDDEDSRNALCTILEALGYDSVSFSGGQDALDAIAELELDLALLDIMMPNMNGMQLMEKIKKIPKFAELPIVMVTAKDNPDEVIEGYQSGADYYITKPYTAKQIDYGLKIYLT